MKMKPQTICWMCEKAIGGCSWSDSFIPVEGWVAESTKIKLNEHEFTDSYRVIACPLFVQDSLQGGLIRIKERKK